MSDKKRYVWIPEPTLRAGEFAFTALVFILHFVENHPAYTRTAAGFRAGQRLLAAFEAGDVAELSNEDWLKLRDICEDPGECGYARLTETGPQGSRTFQAPARLCLPFIEAIVEAGATPPQELPQLEAAAE